MPVNTVRGTNLTTKRKYKPVERKVRPVPTYMPSPEALVFKPIPLSPRAALPVHPRDWEEITPTERMTAERLDMLLKTIPEGFLSREETNLIAHVVDINQDAFAFTFAEKGTFSPEFYPDYEIPTIEHTPWQRPPIRAPKALEDVIRQEILEQEKAGRFEDTTSSYRSALFAVAKKMDKVRLVLDLQELNSVTIRDAALPPTVEEFAEAFIGRAVYGSVDLYAGYDARILAKKSRPLTAFHSICGPKQQATLPMGATNAGAEFQRCIDHALQEDKDVVAKAFMDDGGIMGPTTDYGGETIRGNVHIRRFVFEYAVTLDRILARFIAAGITASGLKTTLATPRLRIVGSVVSLEGWHLEKGLITKILNWPHCENVSQVRGFLGVAGCGRKWIKGFALIAKPLTSLLKFSDAAFVFGRDAEEAMHNLKQAVTQAPVLTRIDYEKAKGISQLPRDTDKGLVIVAVDAASLHGAGWVVYQQINNQKRPAIFGSCTYNERESRYSQPKAELYGVFRAFKHLRHRIWGIRFRLEHDAKFLREMVVTPDLPNAPMTRWIIYLLLFDFEMLHVGAEKHQAPDGLSRRPRSADDSEDEDDADKFLDNLIAYNILGVKPRDRAQRAGIIGALQVKNILQAIATFRVQRTMASSPYQHILHDPHGVLFNSNQPLPARPSIRSESQFGILQNTRPHADARHISEPSRPETFDPNDWTRNGLLSYSLLKTTDNMTYIGREFFNRNVPVEHQVEAKLGGEIITVSVTTYHYSYMGKLRSGAPSPPMFDPERNMNCRAAFRSDNFTSYEPVSLPATWEAIACIGHKFGTLDKDYVGMWDELRQFFTKGVLPELCLTDAKAKAKFLRRANRYFFSEDRLWLKANQKSPSPPRLVIEDHGRRQELLREAHDQCGHRGRDPTYHRLAERVYWPNMYNDCAYFVRSCVPCQLESQSKPIIPYNPSWASTILRHWHLDCIHMPPGHGGKNYLVQATCSASKWDEAEALRRANAENIARFIYCLVCRFSCIPFFTIDGGPEFKGVAEEVYRQYGIVVIISSAYHPQGNGVSERAHQNLVHGLMKICHQDKSRWPLYVDAILFAIRVTTNRVTGYAPYYLVYGIFPVLAFDIEDGTWMTLDWDTVCTTADLIALRAQQIVRRDEVAEQAYQRARFSRQQAIDNFNKRYGRHFSFHGFDVGMWVLRHETWLDNQFGKKDLWRWSGPYIIHEKRPNNSFTLRELNGSVMRGHVSAHRLKLFFFRSEDYIMKTVASTQLYYDIHRFEKQVYRNPRALASLHASRHPDPDFYHYNVDPCDRDENDSQYFQASGARQPLRILYLPGYVSKVENLDLRFRPHWGGPISEEPGFQGFEDLSRRLVAWTIADSIFNEW